MAGGPSCCMPGTPCSVSMAGTCSGGVYPEGCTRQVYTPACTPDLVLGYASYSVRVRYDLVLGLWPRTHPILVIY